MSLHSTNDSENSEGWPAAHGGECYVSNRMVFGRHRIYISTGGQMVFGRQKIALTMANEALAAEMIKLKPDPSEVARLAANIKKVTQ